MSGRLIGLILIACGLLAGGAMYYLQVFGYYSRLTPGDVDLLITRGGVSVPFDAVGLKAIDAPSSPIRFRACFDGGHGAADGADPYPDAVPLNAPFWFGCFDAARLGADLASGAATAYLGEAHVIWGIDRVIAFYPDGQGFAWHQINECGRAAFDGDPVPLDCPTRP